MGPAAAILLMCVAASPATTIEVKDKNRGQPFQDPVRAHVLIFKESEHQPLEEGHTTNGVYLVRAHLDPNQVYNFLVRVSGYRRAVKDSKPEPVISFELVPRFAPAND
jgi:hypothetical protein